MIGIGGLTGAQVAAAIRPKGANRYIDDFANLSSRWEVQNGGTLAVSGGALRATALDDWLGNLVTNGEFTTDTAGWGAYQATRVVVDSTVAPGTVSPGDDSNVLRVEATDTGDPQSPSSNIPTLVGSTIRTAGWAYAPSSNSRDAAAQLSMTGAATEFLSLEDQWEDVYGSRVATGTIWIVRLKVRGTTGTGAVGDIAYFDGITLYRRNTPALLAGWRSPNFVTTLSHISPATGVVPFGIITRYTDLLNYWEVRILPNTAANDLQIVQVTAGVETVRAEADIDWTSGDTDELEVTASGSTISTAHRKTGAGVWTAGPTYASATQGQTSPDLGVMLYEQDVNRLASFEVRRA